MSTFLNRLSQWKPFSVLVVGDFMLDQLVYGDAERLTADAPVPVLHVRRTEETPGGAANVCIDLVALGGRVTAFGVCGGDEEGRVLAGELKEAGVDTSGLIADEDRPTTVKRNLIGLAQHRHPQKMFRVDYESRAPLPEKVVAQLLERFDEALKTADIVALEDYAKGVCSPSLCQEIIKRTKAAGKELIVDPASLDDYSRYAGASAITPNRTEAERATGMRTTDEPTSPATHAIADKLMEVIKPQAVVMTLDRHGALLSRPDQESVHVPTKARQLYDVTGAGDMVLAALVAARANSLDWPDAVRFANAAAGLEVEVFGVKPIPFERVQQALMVEGRDPHDKRRSLEEAAIEVNAAHRDGQRVVFTNGCFDILHAGHIDLLRKARAHGDMLVLGLNSDDSVRRLKGEERPVHDEDDRAAVLSELASVDVVVVFHEDTPERVLETLRPDVLVKGGDYTKEQVVGGSFVESYGGRIELIPFLAGRSTTGAIEKIKAS